MSNSASITSDYDQIAQVVQHYIDGAKSGKGGDMKPAFHQGATIFGYVPDGLFAGPIQQLFDWNEANGPATELEPRIASVDVVDTIASVRLELYDWIGDRFTDLFTLLKLDGEWKIVNKVFHRHEREEGTEDSSEAVTRGAHHIGLTVPDLDETRRFFTDVLAYKEVGDIPDYPAVFLSDGATMITLWQASDPSAALPFDRKNGVGLHHLALAVDGDAGLDALHERLEVSPGVHIEFAPEPLLGGPTRHMMCSIPSGIRVEFIST